MNPKNLFYMMVALLLTLVACGADVAPERGGEVALTPALSTSEATPPAAPVTVVAGADKAITVQADADRDNVFTIRSGRREQLDALQQAFLEAGDGVDVDETGRAILRFSNLLSVEVMRDGELILQELSLDEQSAFISVLQIGGAVIHDFNPEAEIERRFTVQTEFATITATGTRFLVVKETGSPLEWIIGLDAASDDLWVYADGITKTVVSNQARWVAPFGEPSAGIAANMPNVFQWLDKVQHKTAEQEVGEAVWDTADMTANTNTMPNVLQPGQTFDMQFGEQGVVKITLAEQGPFGAPTYHRDDCNNDGISDLIIQRGTLRMDFRPVPARVQSLDVTVINGDQPHTGSLIGFDPANEAINRQELTTGPGEGQILSLRAEQPYHFAELSMLKGCFLGFSLTPPANAPRPAIEHWQDATATEPDAPTPTTAITFINIDSPPRKNNNVLNGFTLSGQATVPFERDLALIIETGAGKVIQMQPLRVDGGELGGAPGVFKAEIIVDYPLPENIRLRVQNLSPRDGSVVAEDSVLLAPLLPQEEIASVERPLENGRLEAIPVGFDRFPNFLKINGDPDDWFKLMEMSGIAWAEIEHLAPDFLTSKTCANRYPALTTPDPAIIDLAGRVAFAYNEKALYTAFWVDDDGFAGYSGNDYRYFRGDAPQLLLDVDLTGDYTSTGLNDDDLQIDLSPGSRGIGTFPQAGLWQLQSLSARALQEAQLVATRTDTGYFIEAAIPWQALNFAPQPGKTLGIVASISENDTPGVELQECMITTAPKRDWRNPTSWGTLVLSP